MEALEEKLRGLSLVRRSRPGLPTYLLNLTQQPSGLLAVSCSNFTVHLHDRDSLRPQGEYLGHSRPVCDVSFAHNSPHLLYSGSADGTVRGWDVRHPGTDAVQLFKSDPAHHYCSFDLSSGDTLLCAGTEQVDQEDSFLVFWDGRKPGASVLGLYSESHSDDITQVRFHPQNKDRMASGSTDGLVNVFDLSKGTEEEALLATCNSDSSAAVVCWCGPDLTRLLCLGHSEGLHLWDLSHLDSDNALTIFSSADARSQVPLPDGNSLDYLVGGCWLDEAQTLLVVGGTNRGDLHLMDCDGEGLRLLKSLKGGHGAVVRCFLWDAAADALVTGGEDAQLLLWKPGGIELTGGRTEMMKSESALKVKSRPHKHHCFHKSRKM